MTGEPKKDYFVLFADILGFSHLTKTSPLSIITPPMFPGVDFKGKVLDIQDVDSRPSSWAFYHFHSFLEGWLQQEARRSTSNDLTVLIFSDSAFVVYNPHDLARLARQWMRWCINNKVAVRMGIGLGTFQPVRFRADTVRNVTIYGAQFYGTGVVNAHDAAHAGPGMRIFVHPSVGDHVSSLRYAPLSKHLALEQLTDRAQWELEYFTDYGEEPQSDPGVKEEDCQTLWTRVHEMKAKSDNINLPRVQLQYTETFAALNRMRAAFDQPPFQAWPESAPPSPAS